MGPSPPQLAGPARRVVAFGELLLRLETPGHARIVQAESFTARYTGAEANVAVALAGLGLDCSVVSTVPDNEVGQACINYLRRFGVRTTHVGRGGPRLGLLYLETGAAPRPTRVVYDRAGSSFAGSTPADYDWTAILDGADWLHFSGTAPSGGAGVAAALGEGVALARSLGVRVSCDLNFRAKLWSEEEAGAALAKLMPSVDVLTGAGEDAARVFGIALEERHLGEHGLNLEGLEHVARTLWERFGVSHIAGVLRLAGATPAPDLIGVLASGSGSSVAMVASRRHEAPTVVDRIGAGDAFSAGVILGLLSGGGPQQAAELAAALYCLGQTVEGDFALVGLGEVEALAAAPVSSRVER